MSDELSPPPLRLKPSIKLDTNTPAAAPSETSLPAADTPTPSSNGVEAPRFRLRPKLDSEIAPQAHGVESAPTDSPALPARPIALKPRMSLAQPIAESLAKAEQTIPQPDVSRTTAEVDAAPPPSTPDSAPPEQQTKFKLKEKAPASAPSAPSLASPASSTPPIPAPVPSNTSKPAFSLTPPPFPVMAGPETSKTSSPLPPPIPSESARGPTRPSRSLRRLLLAALAVTLISGGYLAYEKFTQPAAPVPAPGPIAAAPRPETPSTTLNEISKIPAQAIKKAEDTIAAVNAKDAAGVQAVLSEEAGPKQPEKAASKTVEVAVVPPMSTSQLSPGLTVTTASKDVTGDASPAFRAWVAQARVSGVFQGKPARVLINGRTVPAGQIVDEPLVITFEGIDASAKLLIFRDSTGASVTRRF